MRKNHQTRVDGCDVGINEGVGWMGQCCCFD